MNTGAASRSRTSRSTHMKRCSPSSATLRCNGAPCSQPWNPLRRGSLTALSPRRRNCLSPSGLQTLQRFLRKGQQPPAGIDRYLFYVSYARSDFNELVHKFFGDLVAAIKSIVDIPEQAIGLLDQSRLWPGESFGQQITAAVASSRTAVCLLTPAYISSEYCLAELRLFQEARKPVFSVALSAIESKAGFFSNVPALPGAAGPTLRVPPPFAGSGEAYQAAVNSLATQIVAATQPSAKPQASPSAPEVPVIVLAERRDGIRLVRSKLNAYGLRRRDWWPFASTEERNAGDYIHVAAQAAGVKPNILNLSSAEDWLRLERTARNQKLLMVIDPWSLLLPKRRAFPIRSDPGRSLPYAGRLLRRGRRNPRTCSRAQQARGPNGIYHRDFRFDKPLAAGPQSGRVLFCSS